MINLYDSNIENILPEALAEKPSVKALGYAISQAIQRFYAYSSNTMLFSAIDNMPENIVDLLALELNTQYYDVALPLDIKRNLVKNTFLWYRHSGTAGALTELVNTVFGEGEVIEWWQDNSEPYTFKIRTASPIVVNAVEEFNKMIKNVINIRSHLTSIEFSRSINGECYAVCGQSSYTINQDITEGGI